MKSELLRRSWCGFLALEGKTVDMIDVYKVES